MRYVLFYSNRCDHSRSVLTKLTRLPVAEETSFVCIDSRVSRGNIVYAVLSDGREVPLPAALQAVPALLLLEKGNVLLAGEAVAAHITREYGVGDHVGGQDPTAFSFNEMAGLSDSYAYLDVSAEEMLAQGGGGERIMHSFSHIAGGDSITTPVQVDDSAPKVGALNMETIMAQRATEVPAAIQRE
jgi:hypothetical protein